MYPKSPAREGSTGPWCSQQRERRVCSDATSMSIPQEHMQRSNSSARYDREDMLINRREWLVGSLSAAFWAEVAEAQQKAKLTVLDSSTASEVEAIAAQILPSDDGPGAREAG